MAFNAASNASDYILAIILWHKIDCQTTDLPEGRVREEVRVVDRGCFDSLCGLLAIILSNCLKNRANREG